MKKVPIYYGDGTWFPSVTFSYLAWTKITGKRSMTETPLIYEDDGHTCKQCHGIGTTKIPEIENSTMYCLCKMQHKEAELLGTMAEYNDLHDEKRFSEFLIQGDAEAKKSLKNAKDTMIRFLKELDSWIVLLGVPGCGKSHLMQAGHNYFGAWSLYLSMSNFEHHVFRSMDEDKLDHFISTVQRAPILFIDDIGADYGSAFVKAQIRKVIDFRYMRSQEYPTVVSSNLDPKQLYAYDSRMADRLLDSEKSVLLPIYAQSWRTRELRGGN